MSMTHAKIEPVRWGILGASRFARQVSIPGMKKSALCDVVALASRSLEKARAAAQDLAIPRAYGSYEETLDDPDVEAIYIPLPNHLHVTWTARAARAGKHVLCEKPIALSATEAAPLGGVARETGRFIGEAFMVRCHPQWQAARALIGEDEGSAEDGGVRKIGALRAMQCTFAYRNVDPTNIRNQREIGGGALYDIGCYAVNTARYLFGREPGRVVAACERDPVLGVDRLSSGMLDFGSGQATFTVGTQQTPYQRVVLHGTQGRAEIEIPFNAPPDRPCRLWVDDGRDRFGSGVVERTFPIVDQYALQAESFSRAIREGTPIENPIEDALAGMRVIDALFRSVQSGRWEAPG